MKMFKFLLQHSRKTVILSLIAGAISGACNAVLLAVINSVLKKDGPVGGRLVWMFVGLCLVLPLSRFLAEALLNRLGQEALYRLRMDLGRQILAAPLFHLEKLGAHRLLAALTDDVPTITGTIVVIPLLCINTTVVAGCLLYMGFLSWTLLVIVLAFMVVGIVSYQWPVLAAQNVFFQARKQGDAMLDHFRALTQGTKELKMHGGRREAFLRDVLDVTALSFRRYNIRGLTIYSAASSWGQTLVFVAIGLIVLVMPAWRHFDSKLLVGYTLSLLYLMTPLQVIMNMLPGIARAGVALNNVKELGFDLASQGLEEGYAVSPLVKEWRSLEMQAVSHAYHREGEVNDFVLGPVNLVIQRGEILFITGGNGSGKTTFAKLVTGLYVPQSGEICVDGVAITSENREMYRQYFSAVFSDFFLFEQLLGLHDNELDGRAKDYLDELKLTHKVTVDHGKLSTIDLSQGQRKRLALLTSYLEDRDIYVFDEWAADQDATFRAIFYLQLLPELKARKKTVLVISHDERFYHVADRIVKFEEGVLIRVTTPDALREAVSA